MDLTREEKIKEEEKNLAILKETIRRQQKEIMNWELSEFDFIYKKKAIEETKKLIKKSEKRIESLNY